MPSATLPARLLGQPSSERCSLQRLSLPALCRLSTGSLTALPRRSTGSPTALQRLSGQPSSERCTSKRTPTPRPTVFDSVGDITAGLSAGGGVVTPEEYARQQVRAAAAAPTQLTLTRRQAEGQETTALLTAL
jgi:hypothetical protein